jgi:RNA recognition motif-containing protein
MSEEELKALFEGYSTEEIVLIKDKFSGRSKGFGFVTIADEEVAKKAMSEVNNKEIQGRQIKVSEAKPLEERPERPRRNFGNSERRSFGGRRNFNRDRY